MRKVTAILIALWSAPAMGETCPADPVPPPAVFAAWSTSVTLPAGNDTSGALAVIAGQAARLDLLPTPRATYRVTPEKPPATTSHGGIVTFEVPRAGIYRIGLSDPAWIDVVGEGQAVASAAHGHGPKCSGIRKIVDFALAPGRYLVQISGSEKPTITAMIARAN